MTPADPLGWVDADFVTVGDTLTLMWTGTKWVWSVISLFDDTGVCEVTATD